MSNVHELKPGSYRPVAEASNRIAELGDAFRCIDKMMLGDEEGLGLKSNDLRGLMRVLNREVDAIAEEMIGLL